MDDEYVTMAEAQRILGISRQKIWRMVKDGELAAYQDPKDKRKKLVRRNDIDEVGRVRPLDRRRKAATGESQ